jgi:hypothetical protein
MSDVTPESLGLGGAQRVTMTREQARSNNRLYAKMLDEAKKRGVELEIIDDPQPTLTELYSRGQDGVLTDAEGIRVMPIGRSHARDFTRYERMTNEARQAGCELRIFDDHEAIELSKLKAPEPEPPTAA